MFVSNAISVSEGRSMHHEHIDVLWNLSPPGRTFLSSLLVENPVIGIESSSPGRTVDAQAENVNVAVLKVRPLCEVSPSQFRVTLECEVVVTCNADFLSG